jgi:plastocyanin
MHSDDSTRLRGVLRVSAIAGTVLLLAAASAPRLHGQSAWHAYVGAQSQDLGHQALAFLPNELWIHEGDSVTWSFEVDEIHTVTFLKPAQPRTPFPFGCSFGPLPVFATSPATFDGSTCVSTPPLVKGQSFTVTFPSPGNYKLVCLVHADMTGVVHVLPVSTPLPHEQDYYDDQAADMRRALLTDSDPQNGGHGEHVGHGAHTVRAGTGEISATAGGASTLSIVRFDQSTIRIHAGETVEWTNEDPSTPHTITFGAEPADPMSLVNVTIDPDGARHSVIHSPSESAHSGFIVAAPQDRVGLPQAAPGVTRYRVTFPNAGTFPYICALHDDLGMKGKVVVLP